MAKVIRLPRKHVPSDVDLPIRRGDGDLVPAVAILFLAGLGRVASAIYEHEVFRAEATFALACVIALPWWLVASLRHSRRYAKASKPLGTRTDDGPSAEIIPLRSRLHPQNRENPRSFA